MLKTTSENLSKLNATLAVLDSDFDGGWRSDLEEIAEFVLPRRYYWLDRKGSLTNANAQKKRRTSRILDGTATIAARTLGAGLFNGVTSPARPWFTLRLSEFPEAIEDYPHEYRAWLEESTRRLHLIMAGSNFYNAFGLMYLELAVFGTAAMLIYEDYDKVIRCYNSPCGQYRLSQDERQQVSGFARTIHMTVSQIVAKFGLENCSSEVQHKYKRGGAALGETYRIAHLIRENNPDHPPAIDKRFQFVEIYWERKETSGQLLRLAGFREQAHVTPRWEILGNDTYGTSPSWDALPDIKQLQLETKQKGQALDKMIRPPIVADVALQSNPTALLPGGVSFVPSFSTAGAKPIFTVNPPLADMTNDANVLRDRIGMMYYNHLFRNISSLQTVRSAAEIYERKSEDFLQLGSVYGRFSDEALSVSVNRVFQIALRKELLPALPPGLDPAQAQIKYTSLLAEAQRSIGTQSIEQFMGVIGQLAAAVPDVLDIPNYEELVREYADRLAVPINTINPREVSTAKRQAREEQLAAQNEALVGKDLTAAAKNLSDTDVGGGQNAVEALLNG